MRFFRFLPNPKLGGLILAGYALLACHLAVAAPHLFKAGSLAEIQAGRAGKPFILLFWSLDCASCVKELDSLAAITAKHPDLDLVMVSTDEDSYAKEVEATLSKHGLGKIESWIFADANAQRLRHEIDPTWFGELPRSYFYDAAHHRQPHSGVLGVGQIGSWRISANPTTP